MLSAAQYPAAFVHLVLLRGSRVGTAVVLSPFWSLVLRRELRLLTAHLGLACLLGIDGLVVARCLSLALSLMDWQLPRRTWLALYVALRLLRQQAMVRGEATRLRPSCSEAHLFLAESVAGLPCHSISSHLVSALAFVRGLSAVGAVAVGESVVLLGLQLLEELIHGFLVIKRAALALLSIPPSRLCLRCSLVAGCRYLLGPGDDGGVASVLDIVGRRTSG